MVGNYIGSRAKALRDPCCQSTCLSACLCLCLFIRSFDDKYPGN